MTDLTKINQENNRQIELVFLADLEKESLEIVNNWKSRRIQSMSVDITRLKKDNLIRVDLLGQQIKLFTTWGLFSPKEIDEGSLLLLKYLEIKPTDDVLDLGCG